MSVFDRLIAASKKKGAGFFILIDPDRLGLDEMKRQAKRAESGGADAILIGSSFLLNDDFSLAVKHVKKNASIPVIIFPGGVGQVTREADAILFLSLLSGRNPELLIGQQAKSAPLIHALGLETISTAYLLIESGSVTAAQYISGTLPIPRNKPEIALAHVQAGEFMGMKCAYLDCGSGAAKPVPDEMVSCVTGGSKIPVIVGGGLRSPEEAQKKVRSGASFIVVGTLFEETPEESLLKEFASAIHVKEK